MHIITRARLVEFAKKYPETKTALDTWYRKMKQTNYDNFNELRLTFPSADKIGQCTVFRQLPNNNIPRATTRDCPYATVYDLNKWKGGC